MELRASIFDAVERILNAGVREQGSGISVMEAHDEREDLCQF